LPYFHVVRLNKAALVWADRPLGGAVGPELHRVLQTLLEEGTNPLVIDLVRVPAVDDGAVAALAAATSQAGFLGRAVELRMAAGRSFTVRDAVQMRQVIALAYPTAA
jgi:hypothetical protein